MPTISLQALMRIQPIVKCAATVEKSAAIIAAATTPNQPCGTFVSIAE